MGDLLCKPSSTPKDTEAASVKRSRGQPKMGDMSEL
jgi:hypothetical protein